MIIRNEEEKDFFEVENLTREAFWNVYKPGCDEHAVLHYMRNDADFVPELDFVLEIDGKIVGNIVYVLGKLEKPNKAFEDILVFGPVSILPEYQKLGYGKALINHSLKKAEELGYPMVVITGNPAYYSKFGFDSASKIGIYHDGIDQTEEADFFMAKVLIKEKAKALKGIFYEPKCYFLSSETVEKFDAQFPEKIKEVREGQLG